MLSSRCICAIDNVNAGALAGFFDSTSEQDVALQREACRVSGAQRLMDMLPHGSSEFVSPLIIARLELSDGT